MDGCEVFSGNYISLSEMPIGLVIYDKCKKETVVIGSIEDADLVIKHLMKMKKEWGDSYESL